MQTKHNLSFEVSPWVMPTAVVNDDHVTLQKFRVGSCEGLYGSSKDTYMIIAIINNKPGNGHVDDVFQWFENSCKRDNKKLRVVECWNIGFKNHMISNRGFKDIGNDMLEKVIN